MPDEENCASFPKVCIVGAGFAGICAGIQLKKKLNIHSFVIIERNHDVGGVWLSNIYPGVACDFASFVYSYSFARPKWSDMYFKQEEIWSYLRNVAKEYDLYSHIRLNTSVKSMHWNENKMKWIVTAVNDKGINCVEEYDLAIVATGPWREPNKPARFEAFTGPMMHSAEWNSTIRLENKVVGVVGAGASAVQLIPEIASKTKQLVVYQRNPPYVFPNPPQFRIPWVVQLFCKIPGILPFFRFLTIRVLDHVADSIEKHDGVRYQLALRFHRLYLCSTIKDKMLRNKLTPSQPLGVTIPIVNHKFYKTFKKPNVTLAVRHISSIEGNTITTEDGESNELDVLILCTGFKTQDFFAPIEIIGTNGINLLEEWRKAWPRTYYGLTCHAAPNMFFLVGPNAVPANSVVYLIELQCKFLVKMIALMKCEGNTYFQVKKFVEDECWEEIKSATNQTILGAFGNARNFVTNEFGENTFFWPKKITSYKRRIQNINVEKFNFA